MDATLGSPGAVLGLGSKNRLVAGCWRLEDTAGGSGAALGLEVGVILAAGGVLLCHGKLLLALVGDVGA